MQKNKKKLKSIQISNGRRRIRQAREIAQIQIPQIEIHENAQIQIDV
jgi:hypothetical protein